MSARIGLNQEIIANKALEIADREGMEAVTMANIARELSIKSPSLYNHFKSLKDIKQAMATKAQKLLYQNLKESTKDQKEGIDTIKAIGKAYVAFAYKFPGFYEASITAPDPTSKSVQSFGESIVELTAESLSVYQLNQNEIIHIIRGLRSLLHGLVDLDKKGGFALQVDNEDSLDIILETFISGLKGINKDD